MIAGARDNRQMTHHTLFAPNDSLQDITTGVKELRDKPLLTSGCNYPWDKKKEHLCHRQTRCA